MKCPDPDLSVCRIQSMNCARPCAETRWKLKSLFTPNCQTPTRRKQKRLVAMGPVLTPLKGLRYQRPCTPPWGRQSHQGRRTQPSKCPTASQVFTRWSRWWITKGSWEPGESSWAQTRSCRKTVGWPTASIPRTCAPCRGQTMWRTGTQDTALWHQGRLSPPGCPRRPSSVPALSTLPQQHTLTCARSLCT